MESAVTWKKYKKDLFIILNWEVSRKLIKLFFFRTKEFRFILLAKCIINHVLYGKVHCNELFLFLTPLNKNKFKNGCDTYSSSGLKLVQSEFCLGDRMSQTLLLFYFPSGSVIWERKNKLPQCHWHRANPKFCKIPNVLVNSNPYTCKCFRPRINSSIKNPW
jgi:hypothetical protein